MSQFQKMFLFSHGEVRVFTGQTLTSHFTYTVELEGYFNNSLYVGRGG